MNALRRVGWTIVLVAGIADLISDLYYSLFTKVEHPLHPGFVHFGPIMVVGLLLIGIAKLWDRFNGARRPARP